MVIFKTYFTSECLTPNVCLHMGDGQKERMKSKLTPEVLVELGLPSPRTGNSKGKSWSEEKIIGEKATNSRSLHLLMPASFFCYTQQHFFQGKVIDLIDPIKEHSSNHVHSGQFHHSLKVLAHDLPPHTLLNASSFLQGSHCIQWTRDDVGPSWRGGVRWCQLHSELWQKFHPNATLQRALHGILGVNSAITMWFCFFFLPCFSLPRPLIPGATP